MDITITNTTEQPLLKRSIVECSYAAQSATPSRTAVAKMVAEKVGAKKDAVVVQHIRPAFGDSVGTIECMVYQDAALMQRIERANLLAKHVEKEAPAPEPAPAAEQAPSEQASEPSE